MASSQPGVGRIVLGVVAGYAAMFVTIFSTFSIAFLVMGQDRAYEEGSFDVSTLWLAVTIPIGFAAAMVGGAVARLTGRSMRATIALVIVAGLLGIGQAVMTYQKNADAGEPEPRVGDVAIADAMGKSRMPTWAAALNPVLLLVGAPFGASLVGGGKTRER